MRKDKLLRETQRHRMLETSGINAVLNQNVISVDIQEAYADYMGFQASAFGDMINQNFNEMNSLTFLFNGPDLGFPDEQQYKYWLMETCGIEEDIVDSSNFYDKGYAFFRYCMDEGIDDDELVDFIKFMITHGINDSRSIDAEMWKQFQTEYGYQDIQDLLEPAEDMINIPDLMDFLGRYGSNLLLCGGGINECLKEVELALMVLDKPYNVLTPWTY